MYKIITINFSLLVLLLISIPVAVSLGTIDIGAKQVMHVVINQCSCLENLLSDVQSVPKHLDVIVWQLRLPRVLMAAIAGAGLALSGLILQSITRNALADPHLLGISSGAILGAVIVTLYTGEFMGSFTLPFAAFIGSLVATLVIVVITFSGRVQSASSLLMCGVSLSFVLLSLANFLLFVGDNRASHQVIFWTMGGLGMARWQYLIIPALILAGTLVTLQYYARYLNALLMGDETAKSLGIDVVKLRLLFFVISALMTSVLVANIGAIGFVGLMVPHIARYFIGSDITRLVSVVALVGALLLVWVDVISRTIMGDQDLPVGIITGFLGGIFFIVLMLKKHGVR